jgi:hypothetical protein
LEGAGSATSLNALKDGLLSLGGGGWRIWDVWKSHVACILLMMILLKWKKMSKRAVEL